MSVLHLQHLRSDGERDTFHLKNVRRYNLGRGSTCELRILDMKMSRQHCAFEYNDGAWQLIDLGSTNGVNVDGTRVNGRVALNAGEVVYAGSVELNVLAINEHIDLAPEELMLLGSAAPSQDPLPNVTQDVPVAKDDNPWEGEPQAEKSSRSDALQAVEDHVTEAVHKSKPSPLKAVRTPVPEPEAALPHQDGDALEESSAKLPAVSVAAPPAPVPAPKVSSAPPERTKSSGDLVITVLDRRIGPVSRDVARELKKKQIMGTLTNAELDQYPQA